MDDMTPVYATLHFYYDDPDSMARLKVCNEAEDVLLAVDSYARWLRDKIKYGGDDDGDPKLTEAWNMLFECFNDNGVNVPGWE